MRLLPILATLLGAYQVQAKAVFAHFMVDNTDAYTLSDWQNDIALAQAAHIDAFALNIAYAASYNTLSLANAFTAANNLGFKLFLSFDYAGNGYWPQDQVTSIINQYGSNAAYYLYKSKPLVSTFEGPGISSQWTTIKAQTGCYFIPDWSSLGAQAAVNTGVVDGLFNWGAWPTGPADMDTSLDVSYMNTLGSKEYMMPVSPWFFTNLPSWSKNWLWRGDDLWYDRWQEVIDLQPEFVEILTWNDYGESHYIGPLPSHNTEYGLFTYGQAPYNYAQNMPHDGWRLFLPYLIDTYKNGAASISQEGLVSWYRLNPALACATGGTTGNTASQGQTEYAPSAIAQDKIFYSALLSSSATVTVSIGGVVQSGTWENIPSGGKGVYHGSVPFNGNTGAVIVTISRSGSVVAQMIGNSITTSCTSGIENWNAWVGSATAATVSTTSTSSSSTSTSSSTTSSLTSTTSSSLSTSTSSSTTSTPTSTTLSTSTTSTPTSSTSSTSSTSTSSSTTSTSSSSTFSSSTTSTSTSRSTTSTSSSTTSSPTSTSSSTSSTSSSSPTSTRTSTTSTLSSSTSTSSSTTSSPTSTRSSTTSTSSSSSSTSPTSTRTSTTSSSSSTSTSTFVTSTRSSTTSSSSSTTSTSSSAASSSSSVCVAGWGAGNYAGLCSFTCNYGYCPAGVCTCTSMGNQITPPPVTGVQGYPAPGLDGSYTGLCSFTCNHGYCPSGACISY